MIYTIGEALVDLIPNQETFTPYVGGAPANVAMAARKLGSKTSFIGKIGNDSYGKFILNTLKGLHVDTSYVFMSDQHPTCEVQVGLNENHDRYFVSRTPLSADLFLKSDEIQNIPFQKEDTLHFCSVDLTNFPVKEATITCIEHIKQKNGIVSFDPNVRLPFWESEEACKKTIFSFFPVADIVKMSDEDLKFLFPNQKMDDVATYLFQRGIQIVLFTLGSQGSMAYYEGKKYFQKAFSVPVVDTTGAGDVFIGSFLFFFREEKKAIQEAHYYASISSAIICTKEGVASHLPNQNDLKKFSQNQT